MPSAVDFVDVSTAGLESSPVAAALAGLRANEARYSKNKYDHDFATSPAAEVPEVVERVARILREERGIVIASPRSRRPSSRSRTSAGRTSSTRAASR